MNGRGLETRQFPFVCPYCGERITVLLDMSAAGVQRYIEDCEVCCNPIEIRFEADEGSIMSFEAREA